jgi:PAS domain S-box-containing protein
MNKRFRSPISINRFVKCLVLGFYLAIGALAALVIGRSGMMQRLWNAPLMELQSNAELASEAFQDEFIKIEADAELTAAMLEKTFDREAFDRDPEAYLPRFFRAGEAGQRAIAELPRVKEVAFILDSSDQGFRNAFGIASGQGAIREYRPFPSRSSDGSPGWYEGPDSDAGRQLAYYASFANGRGVVAVYCDFVAIASFVAELPEPPDACVALIDRDGALVARGRADFSDLELSRAAVMAVSVTPRAPPAPPWPVRGFNLDGKRVYVARADLRSGLRFISLAPSWKVQRSITLSVAAFAFIALIALALAILSSFLIGRFVSVPLERLSSGALAVVSGKSGSLPADSGPREIRLLAKALNKAVLDIDEKARQQKLLMESDARIDLLSVYLGREKISSLNGFRLFGVEGRSEEMDFREWVEHFHIAALEKNYNPLLSSSYQERSGREQSPADMLAEFREMETGENRQSEFTFDSLKGEEGFLRVNMVRISPDVVLAACVDLTEEYRTRRELFVLSTRLSYALNATQSVAIFDVSFETMELWASESFFPIFEIEMPPAGTLILPGFEKRLAAGYPPLLDISEGYTPSDFWKKGNRVFKLNLPRSGANRWIEVRTAETVRGIIGTVIDITREVLEKHAAQEKADTAQELSRVILTALTEAVVGMGREGRCVFLNPAAETLLGFEQADLVGQDLRPIFAPVDPAGRRMEAASSPLERALRDHVPVSSDYQRFRRNDGSFYQASIRVQPLFKGGEFIGAVASLVDVSNLVELSNRFGAMLSNAVDQIYMADRDLKITMVSDSILKFMGVDGSSGILGKSMLDILPSDVAGEFHACEERVIDTGHPVRDLVMNIHYPDGPRWLNIAIIPLRDAQGEMIGVFGIARDITEANRLDDELRAAKIEAERANQAKSIFLAGMSHEIRTPLNAILGYSQLMAGKPGMGPDDRRMVDTIMRSGEHLLDLINSILEISKIEAGRLSSFLATADLFRLLNDIESMFRIRTEAKGLRFEVRRESSVPRWIITDAQKLRQILINILGNAVKFTDKGGVSLTALVRGSMLAFEVRDSGPGISDDEKERLFAPFMQGKAGVDSQGGTGLGLAISRDYAKLMGGTLVVEDAPDGIGSLFRCEIALTEAAAGIEGPVGERRTVAGFADPAAAPTVLNVDDSEPNRRLVRDMLAPLGFRLIDARNGREAIEAIAEGSPDLVLMDIIMPGMDGIEAIEKIRSGKKRGGIPIIALTASAFEEDRRRVMAAGANDFIRKPIDREELLEKIRRAIGLEYRYNERVEPEFAALMGTGPIDLGKVPAALRRELRKAAVELAPFQAAEVVKAIADIDSYAAAGLLGLVERFDFQAIIGLLDEGEKKYE